ncbi:tRNA pseudouridine(13) synthase TruD [Nitrincola sp. MINF-07-Sa-05]|uniref:tRNA pseudouridine(13) synthase TruD n=1 Tax=Nitrincola salilacus TaxID=3400273 RepID=UPI003917C715
MTQLKADPEQLPWLYERPQGSARIRVQPEDFCVSEELGFEPCGEGEHLFLQIRKTSENTDWVARQLAKFCAIDPRHVTYAGKKDRHAVTDQWFCVHWPIASREPSWSLFESDTIKVLRSVRHQRKLKLGTLKANHFSIRLRDVTHPDELERRLGLIVSGVPNYFGEQRFGHAGGNLLKGDALISGVLKERQRHKRGLYISALRSWLFNAVVAGRIRQGLWDNLLAGDVLMQREGQSCFVEDGSADLLDRIRAGSLHLTAPMWGRGELMTQGAAAELERSLIADWQVWADALVQLGLNQERRAIKLIPGNMTVTAETDRQWLVSFSLSTGSFATSVLREVCHLENEQQIHSLTD